MAEKAKGSGISKRLGPLPVWAYPAIGVGAFIIYRYLKARSAASAALAASGTTGGTTIPPAGQITGTPSSGTTFSSVADWEQAALQYLTTSSGLTGGQAFNAISDWLNGNCVSQAAYNGLSSAIANSSIGLPPGYGTSLPTLTVCATHKKSTGGGGGTSSGGGGPVAGPAKQTPIFPGLSGIPGLSAAMTANGETVAAQAWDPVLNEFIVLTNKGGIYNVAPSGKAGGTFYGSYLGLPAADRQGGARTFNGLTINSNGTYTIVDTAGESYTFTPTTPQAA